METQDLEKKEDWMSKRWRPAMAMLYMAICACDFIIFPVLWSIHQSMMHGQTSIQWTPLTLQGAGLLHLAFGAILGVAAYGRTQEKLAGATMMNTQNGYGYTQNGYGHQNCPPPYPQRAPMQARPIPHAEQEVL